MPTDEDSEHEHGEHGPERERLLRFLRGEVELIQNIDKRTKAMTENLEILKSKRESRWIYVAGMVAMVGTVLLTMVVLLLRG